MQTIKFDKEKVAIASVVTTNRTATYNAPANYWDISGMDTREMSSDTSLLVAQDNYGTGVQCRENGWAHVVAKFRCNYVGPGAPMTPNTCTIRVGGVEQRVHEVSFDKEWSYIDTFYVTKNQFIQFYTHDAINVQEIQISVFFVAD